MTLTHKAKRRWALVVLLLGLPAYIGLAWWLVSLFDRPSILIELAIYSGLGILWVVPLKAVFKGVGQADPERNEDSDQG